MKEIEHSSEMRWKEISKEREVDKQELMKSECSRSNGEYVGDMSSGMSRDPKVRQSRSVEIICNQVCATLVNIIKHASPYGVKF